MEKTISMSTLTKHAKRIAKDIETSRTMYRITQSGASDLLLMTAEEYEGWMMAVEIMQRPNWREEWDQACREFESGDGRTLEEISAELGLDRPVQQNRRPAAKRATRVRRAKGKGRGASARRRSS